MESEHQNFKARTQVLSEQNKAQKTQIQRLQQHDRYLITVERMVRIYEELTGLTIQAVEDGKRRFTPDGESGEEDNGCEDTAVVVYKCRQSGRNGGL